MEHKDKKGRMQYIYTLNMLMLVLGSALILLLVDDKNTENICFTIWAVGMIIVDKIDTGFNR